MASLPPEPRAPPRPQAPQSTWTLLAPHMPPKPPSPPSPPSRQAARAPEPLPAHPPINLDSRDRRNGDNSYGLLQFFFALGSPLRIGHRVLEKCRVLIHYLLLFPVLTLIITSCTFNLFLLRVIFSDIFAQTPPLQLPVAEPLDTHTSQDSSACPLNVPQLFGWW